MEKEKINRINDLARKSKVTPLSTEELAEQKALRDEYIAEIRASFGAIPAQAEIKKMTEALDSLSSFCFFYLF